MTHHPLTFLFTDIENSTPLWEQFPDEMQQSSARHDAVMREIIEIHQGRVVKTTGDGFHAVFEAPSDGVAAALAGQKALSAETWSPASGPLKIRMGLHTGESQSRDGDYYGPEVNRAARVMGLGHGGQVLISEVTAALTRKSLPPDCTLADLGQHRLKGIAAPEQIFQLCHPDLIPEFPPLKSLSSFKHNLGRQLSSFIGREKELEDIKRMMQSTQLLTLLGPGGTGKTRLMLQVAEETIEEYPDGVWLIELAPLSDPDLIPERVATALNIQEQPNRSLLETLTSYLQHKDALLLLDNVEHLIHGSAVFVEYILERCPKIKFLVTGREALFINGEITLQVPSFSIPEGNLTPEKIAASEGVQLFIERARAVQSEFDLTQQNAASIANIVRRLDGIPLAIELAAARLRMLDVEQIDARLNDRFRLLTGGRRTALPRQQTLQALIDWSWNLLDKQEQVLLCRLSVFSGGWTIDAAQSVAGFDPLDEFDVFDKLELLINKSLVTVHHIVEAETRYGMLESIRQYAQGKLFESGEGETLRDRHVDYFVALVDDFGQSGIVSGYFTWMEKFSFDADNLRAVVEWIGEDRPHLALHFTGILLQYDPNWLPYREARSWLEPVVEQARDLLEDPNTNVNCTDFIKALQSLGWLLVTHGEMLRGHALLDECIHLAREHDEYQIMAITLGMKSQALGSNVSNELIAQMEEVVDRCRQNNDEIELLMVLFSISQAHFLQGRLDKGKTYLEEVTQLLAKYDVPFIDTWIYYLQAMMEQAAKNLDKAEEYLLLAIEANEKWGQHRMATTARSELAHQYRQQNRLNEAAELYHQTIRSWQEQGHLAAVAHQIECFAYIAIARKQYEHAAHLLGAAQEARQQHNSLSTESQEIADLEQAMCQLEEKMSKEQRDQNLAKGTQISLDEAVGLAIQTISVAPLNQY